MPFHSHKADRMASAMRPLAADRPQSEKHDRDTQSVGDDLRRPDRLVVVSNSE